MHGCLHLLNYDHINEADAINNGRIGNADLLKVMGISDPYLENKLTCHNFGKDQMTDIKKGNTNVTQGVHLSQKNVQSGFFKRLLSGLDSNKGFD